MSASSITVVKVRDVLLVAMPSDPDDSVITALQEQAMRSMDQHEAKALILDISAVETLDSFFARTISETAQMVSLMGGRTIIAGMRPAVAVTATQLGLPLKRVETALTVERALDMVSLGKRQGSAR
ncbi:MAG: STAS domain-containing protein [Planctomycetota bacterium]|nr:STAS domain-containing protein [Planctomycetota bacterium]